MTNALPEKRGHVTTFEWPHPGRKTSVTLISCQVNDAVAIVLFRVLNSSLDQTMGMVAAKPELIHSEGGRSNGSIFPSPC